jgi:hypothetical protein
MAEPKISSAEEALLAAVAVRRKRDLSVLTDRQELLVDDWRAGRLSADQAVEAERLVRTNAVAAERVLERQLMEVAEASSPISSELEARILASVAPKPAAKQPRFFYRLRRLNIWQVSGLGGALTAAAAAVALFVSSPQHSGSAPIQLAMASISERDVLFEASDVRTRGASQTAPLAQRFKDIVIPSTTLEGLLDAENSWEQRAALEDFKKKAGIIDEKAFVFVDAALMEKALTKGATNVGVRLYDLRDNRVAEVLATIKPRPPEGAAYLVTIQP